MSDRRRGERLHCRTMKSTRPVLPDERKEGSSGPTKILRHENTLDKGDEIIQEEVWGKEDRDRS